VARRLRLIGRTLARRTGERRAEVLRLTAETGELLQRSVAEARRLASALRAGARGRGAQAKLAAAERLGALAENAEKVTRQIAQRLAAEPITDRLVSLADPDARPIRKGKAGKPVEFGYVFQLAELTENTRRGARGFILPPASAIGSPNETELLPQTATELERAGLRPREVALDGGFQPTTTNPLLPQGAEVFIAGRQQPDSRRSRRRLARYRVGCEGRISHLKRSYGLGRARLRGHPGAETWVGWAVLVYNLDTLAIRTA
jgi:IS5 family transposase